VLVEVGVDPDRAGVQARLVREGAGPDVGWRLYGGTLVTSLIAWAIRVASRSRCSGTIGWPSLSCRLLTTVSRSALPVRSP